MYHQVPCAGHVIIARRNENPVAGRSRMGCREQQSWEVVLERPETDALQ